MVSRTRESAVLLLSSSQQHTHVCGCSRDPTVLYYGTTIEQPDAPGSVWALAREVDRAPLGSWPNSQTPSALCVAIRTWLRSERLIA
jgi:hypothetical protein